MKIKNLLTPVLLPLALAISLPAYSYTIDTFTLSNVADAANKELLSGSWTVDSRTGLTSGLFTQTDTVWGKTYTYDFSYANNKAGAGVNFTAYGPVTNSAFIALQADYDKSHLTSTGAIIPGLGPGFYVQSKTVSPAPIVIPLGTSSFLLDAGNPLASTINDTKGAQYYLSGSISVSATSFPDTSHVPEPAMLALIAAGFLGFGIVSRKRKQLA